MKFFNQEEATLNQKIDKEKIHVKLRRFHIYTNITIVVIVVVVVVVCHHHHIGNFLRTPHRHAFSRRKERKKSS
jgi:uncharacterized protein HemY